MEIAEQWSMVDVETAHIVIDAREAAAAKALAKSSKSK